MNTHIHQSNIEFRHSGSGDWLLKNPDFENWVANKGIENCYNLCLTGSPGAGKSFLCSRAIEHISSLQKICLYHFYRFDDRTTSISIEGRSSQTNAVRTASILVDQLFQYFCDKNRRTAGAISRFAELCRFTEQSEKNLTNLREATRIILAEAAEDLQRAPQITIFMFLDGLDELQCPSGVDEIMNVFRGLEQDPPIAVKAWMSSRTGSDRNFILDGSFSIHFDEHSEADVGIYLDEEVQKFTKSIDKVQSMAGQSCKCPL